MLVNRYLSLVKDIIVLGGMQAGHGAYFNPPFYSL